MKGKIPVIFDLDGTLFRTETVDIAAFNRALAANGLEGRTEAEILNCIGLTMHEVCITLGITDAEFEEKFTSDVISFEREEIEKSGKLYDGVEEFLKRLKADGFKICICSNGGTEYVYGVLDKFSLTGLFDEVWPQKDGFSKTEAVGLLAGRFADGCFIMAGDRSSDMEAARENGGISIGMTHGFGGDEVSSADYTAGNIGELEKIIYDIAENKI